MPCGHRTGGILMSEVDSLTRALREGRISRRRFIGDATLLGLSTSAILALLEACQSTTGSSGTGRKAKMVVGVDTDIDDLDPMDFKSDAAYEVVIQTYEMPVDNVTRAGAGGILEATNDLQGALATSFAASADGTRYTFKVRPNVTFSHGK